MPRPVDANARYEPALDGIRALAVAAVLGYHLGVPLLAGGLLGVGVFFTLSGYLITTILLTSWGRFGDLQLRRFWTRRARRLLPALALVLVVVLLATAISDRQQFAGRAGGSLWAAFYVSNWATIVSGASYFDRFANPGPLDHLWSLAVEEQFYLLWPLVLWGLLRLTGSRLARTALATLGLAVLSFGLLAWLARQGFDNTRAYEGTDTRAGGVLIGAALAMVWRPGRRAHEVSRASSRTLDAAGGVAIVVIGVLVMTTNDYSLSLYRWGLLVLSIATAVVVAVAVHPGSHVVRRALGTTPLVWIGERSYGIYLWHLPVIAFTPAEFLQGRTVARGAIQLALTLLAASASWTLIEDPIRRHGITGVFGPLTTSPRLPVQLRRVLNAPTLLVALATMGLLAAWVVTPDAGEGQQLLSSSLGGEFEIDTSATTSTTPVVTTPGAPSPAVPSASSTTTTTIPPSGPQTRCASVVHIGDSTSLGLAAPSVLPNPKDRINYKYGQAGVLDTRLDISGARSIVETSGTHPNARTTVASVMSSGYDGCWVFAMGTNDTANRFVGSVVGPDERIDRVMSLIGDHPVMWLTVKTLRTSGPYSEAQMQLWNDALGAACARYPNMRVYNWAGQVSDSWYIPDGIHFTSVGYRWRAALTAEALAVAFPEDGSISPGCFVVPP